jgi:uncharacterized protein YraI
MSHLRYFVMSMLVVVAFAYGAEAQTAYTNRSTNLRAGPSQSYEIVARLAPGTPVAVAGCLNDWSWCDVTLEEDRGWVYAANLDYPYEDGRVPIITGGVYLGLPIVTFSIGPYWDSYYRARPWYGRRHYWELHPPLPHGPWGHRPGFLPPGHRPPGFHPPGWHSGREDFHPRDGRHGHGDLRPRDGHRDHGDLRPRGGDRRPPLQPRHGTNPQKPRSSPDDHKRDRNPH